MSNSKSASTRNQGRAPGRSTTGIGTTGLALNGTGRSSLVSLLCLGAGTLLAVVSACNGETESEPNDRGKSSGGTPSAESSGGKSGSPAMGSGGDSTSPGGGGAPGTTGGNPGTAGADGGGAGDAPRGGEGGLGTAGEPGVGGAAGEPGEPGESSIAACEDGEASSCPNDAPLCAKRSGAGTGAVGASGGSYTFFTNYTFCTKTCDTTKDCGYDLPAGVSATPVCTTFDGSNDKVCSLDCSLGRSCPAGMICYGNTCMHKHCSCSGSCTGAECK
jgi:hypothetical protein